MPIFLYRHPKTNEIREIVQSVHEEHVYYDKDGLKWEREFTVPTASTDTRWNPDDPKDFVVKSKNKRGTLGDLEDKSKELSLQREKRYGRDAFKEKTYENYSKLRGGKIHPEKRKEKLKELTSKPIEFKIKR